MADHPTPNGADAGEPRERPSWYVPIRDRKPGAPTTQELLDNMTGAGDPQEPGPEADDIDAYLERFLQPSDP